MAEEIRNPDQAAFASSLETAIINRFSSGLEGRLVAKARINSSSRRAVAYDLFRYYGLPYSRLRTATRIELPEEPCHSTEDGERDLCWECRGFDRPETLTKIKLSARASKAVVTVELPPTPDFPTKPRLFPELETPYPYPATWEVAPGFLKNQSSTTPIRMFYVYPGKNGPVTAKGLRLEGAPHPLSEIVWGASHRRAVSSS